MAPPAMRATRGGPPPAASASITLRDVLLAEARDDADRDALRVAIDYLETAMRAIRDGRATLEDVDKCAPFVIGSDPWFYLVLLVNKPCKTLYGPYDPLIARGSTAKAQAILDGFVCADCSKAGGRNSTVTLRRCGHCHRVSYCGRACQRRHYDNGHRDECQAHQKDREKLRESRARTSRVVLPATADLPPQPLLVRHLRDGLGTSSLVLFKDPGRDVAPDDEICWGIPTVPVRDDDLRDSLLGPFEACFNVARHGREYDALVKAKIATPMPDKVYETAEGKTYPIARIEIPQIDPRDPY